MSSLHDNPFLLASGSPTDPTFPVQRSVRLRSSASAYFNRTTTTPTSGSIFTHSFWVKRGVLGSQVTLISGARPTNFDRIYLSSTDTLVYQWNDGTSNLLFLETTQVFRDPSAWYHIIVATDTTQATNTNRVKIYVNGVQVTAFSTATYPTQNSTSYLNINSGTLNLGRTSTAVSYFDGYLTEVNFIDGQALTPSSFGGYNTGTGVWEPRKYSGTYGTNGFYLNFQDNSAATATTIGKDSSGNGNNWTPNNISVTAGTTYDSMLDVPTNTSPTNANFAVLNPINAPFASATNTFSQGNLYVVMSATGANDCSATSTIGFSSGKIYYEATIVSRNNTYGYPCAVGITSNAQSTSSAFAATSYFYNSKTGEKLSNTGTFVAAAYGATYTNGDIIGVAFDADAGTLEFYKNGTSQGVAFTGIAANTWYLRIGSNDGCTVALNCGQRPFSYTPPTGFQRLNTFNLPDPTIPSGDDFHKVYTYTGNGGGLQVGEIQKPASLFNLDRSLRLRSSASAYLSRTPASAGNRKTWTMAFWVKRGVVSTGQQLWYTGSGSTYFNQFYFEASGSLSLFERTSGGGGSNGLFTTTQVFRDPSMWYHIVCVWDTTQASQENRIKIYVNNVLQSGTWTTYPTLNYDGWFNTAAAHRIGWDSSTAYFDGYLADFYFIDGQALTPTDFGAYDGNFYWTPKAYTGTYGTNGFHLEFEDNSAATAAAIGKDTSGNVNNWTPSGISVTAGITYDSMTDVPTLTSTNVANFATFNPINLSTSSPPTVSNGNLQSATTTTGFCVTLGTIGISSGKFYWEITPTAFGGVATYDIGIANSSANLNEYLGQNNNSWGYYLDGNKYTGNTPTAYGASYTTNDVIGVALDMDAGTIVFYKNGTSQGTAFTGLTGTIFPAISDGSSSYSATFVANFGQRPFTYTPPTGFKSINSFNIAEVTDDLESPDFVWIKSRSAATSHALFNSVTGVNKYLSSNATTAETTDVNSLIQFNKNGFLLGNAAIVNTSAATYVASAWKAGGAAVTNTAGSITSQVSANQKSGFSVVTYTGTGANATVGHGLGIAPKMMIIKSRVSAVENWWVWHTSLPTPTNSRILLNTTAAYDSGAASYWNSAIPTSSVFSLGTTAGNNGSGATYVAYCFSEIAGFSKFGSYTGNGSADGVFVYLGFRPRWIMIKYSSGVDNWAIFDTARLGYNADNNELLANTTGAEGTTDFIDILSNGFKNRNSDARCNGSGATYIYAAFAENPFKYSLAR
jgi:hypothetical protein